MEPANDLSQTCQLIIQKAHRSLAAARQLVKAGDYDFASSRAYYAAFYAMQAALLTQNLSASKHSGVIRLFNRHFIKTGIFPPEFSKSISRLFTERQTGDYRFELSIDRSEAAQNLQIAQEVVDAVIAYLDDKGLLSESAP